MMRSESAIASSPSGTLIKDPVPAGVTGNKAPSGGPIIGATNAGQVSVAIALMS